MASDKLIVCDSDSGASSSSTNSSDEEYNSVGENETKTPEIKTEPSDVEEINQSGIEELLPSDNNQEDVKPDVKNVRKLIKLEASADGVSRAAVRRRMSERTKFENLCRVVPDPGLDRDKERRLCRIATEGVVQLFNAIAERQTSVRNEMSNAGNSEFKRLDAKYTKLADKNDFERKLKRQSSSKSTETRSSKKEPKIESN